MSKDFENLSFGQLSLLPFSVRYRPWFVSFAAEHPSELSEEEAETLPLGVLTALFPEVMLYGLNHDDTQTIVSTMVQANSMVRDANKSLAINSVLSQLARSYATNLGYHTVMRSHFSFLFPESSTLLRDHINTLSLDSWVGGLRHATFGLTEAMILNGLDVDTGRPQDDTPAYEGMKICVQLWDNFKEQFSSLEMP